LGNLWHAFSEGLQQHPPTSEAAQSLGQVIARGTGSILPGAIGTGLLGAAFAGAGKGVGAIRERFAKARDFKQMMEANPRLHKEDAGHIQSLYNSLRAMSPDMAKDPLIAGSFVHQMMERAPEGGPMIPIETSKLLSETTRNLSQARGSHPFLDSMKFSPLPALAPAQVQSPQPRLIGERRFGPGGEELGRTEKEYA